MSSKYFTGDKKANLDQLFNFISAYNKIKVSKGGKPVEILDIKDSASVLKQLKSNIAKIKKGVELKKLSLDLGDGAKVQMNHIHKDQTEKKVIKVIGNILEGLTGLAVATLLAKKGDVTAETMKEIGTKLPTGRKVSTPVAIKTERGEGKDFVKFKFSAPTEAEEDLLQDLIKWNFDLKSNMEELENANVSISSGIEGDARGKKRNRQITILFEDDWYDACKDIDKDLHWTKRRANLFVKGMRGPQKEGDIIEIGNIKLKVSFETDPCEVMESTYQGLRQALEPKMERGRMLLCN